MMLIENYYYYYIFSISNLSMYALVTSLPSFFLRSYVLTIFGLFTPSSSVDFFSLEDMCSRSLSIALTIPFDISTLASEDFSSLGGKSLRPLSIALTIPFDISSSAASEDFFSLGDKSLRALATALAAPSSALSYFVSSLQVLETSLHLSL